MTTNKPMFHLSQSNLQDFHECPRRFQLKVVENIAWPAASLEPISQLERSTDLGNKFHQHCHQFFSGIAPDTISESIVDQELQTMWEIFYPFAEVLPGYTKFSEIILSTPFLDHQLIAKYDLVYKTDAGKFVIYDWKTAAKKPSRTILAQRYQTILYPFIFMNAGNTVFKTDQLSTSDISMNYWYPLSSDPEEIFPYSDNLHSNFLRDLTKTVNDIDDLIAGGNNFPLTEDQIQCQKCVYRSLCERGIHIATLDQYTEIEQEDLSNQHFDFDLISEIEY